VVFAVSVVVKEGMASFSIWAGKKLESPVLIADGWHHRSDAIASALIIVGLLLGRHLWWVDGALGILVSLMIAYATVEIFRNSFSTLLGEKPKPDFEQRLREVIKKAAPMVSTFHHLHVHKYGDHTELTFHIQLPAAMPLEEAHGIASALERSVRNEMHMETTVHLEPDTDEPTRTY
jgi:cation diffusion facilitator family transporter